MHAHWHVFAMAALLALGAPQARAAVNVERHGAENPMVEVARSTIYGAMAGTVVGGAIALAAEGDDDGDFIRWGFVAGTVAGLAWGVHFAATRPGPSALLELDAGGARLGAPLPEASPRGGARLALVALSF